MEQKRYKDILLKEKIIIKTKKTKIKTIKRRSQEYKSEILIVLEETDQKDNKYYNRIKKEKYN